MRRPEPDWIRELPSGLAHFGDGHPQTDSPGGDAGPGDELLDCEAYGFCVGFRVGQGGVGRQGCPDPGTLVGDDDVEGVAAAVRHEADVYVCAVWGGMPCSAASLTSSEKVSATAAHIPTLG